MKDMDKKKPGFQNGCRVGEPLLRFSRTCSKCARDCVHVFTEYMTACGTFCAPASWKQIGARQGSIAPGLTPRLDKLRLPPPHPNTNARKRHPAKAPRKTKRQAPKKEPTPASAGPFLFVWLTAPACEHASVWHQAARCWSRKSASCALGRAPLMVATA